MARWRVVCEETRRAVIFVECDTKEEAEEAAENLASDSGDFEELDHDYTAREVNPNLVDSQEPYWTGGESGHWVDPVVRTRKPPKPQS